MIRDFLSRSFMRDFNAANIVVNKSYECRCCKGNQQTNTHANCRFKGLCFKRRPIKLRSKFVESDSAAISGLYCSFGSIGSISF